MTTCPHCKKDDEGMVQRGSCRYCGYRPSPTPVKDERTPVHAIWAAAWKGLKTDIWRFLKVAIPVYVLLSRDGFARSSPDLPACVSG
jgi:C4-type Zn-finger protein